MFRSSVVALALSFSFGTTAAEGGSSALTPVGELSVSDVQALLHAWRLDQAFAKGFAANQYDGEMLEALLDVPRATIADTMQAQFPKAVSPQWIKLVNRIQRVAEDGGVYIDGLVAGAAADADTTTDDDDAKAPFRRLLSDEFDGFSGLSIDKDEALISMGLDGDVALVRKDASTLHVSADAVEFSADTVSFSAANGLVANGTDLVKEVEYLLAEAATARRDIRRLKQEMYYVMTEVNTTCYPVDEDAYDCNDATLEFEGECVEDITTDTYAWTDRTYSFLYAPADLLDTYHTYVQVEMDGSPPCSTEGGYYGDLAVDAQVAICCANHGTYSAAGNMPYATSGSEGLDYAYGLDWTEHDGEFALGNHGGTPCTYFETFLEAGTHLVCCSEGWATGVFLTTPEVKCD